MSILRTIQGPDTVVVCNGRKQIANQTERAFQFRFKCNVGVKIVPHFFGSTTFTDTDLNISFQRTFRTPESTLHLRPRRIVTA